MISTSSALLASSSREFEAFAFMVCPEDPAIGVSFQKVSESNIEPGDIILFPMENSWGKVSRLFKHAAVYCGDGEVIHFQYIDADSKSGLISKEGFEAMKRTREKCDVYRRVGGINLQEFRRKIKEAMNCEATYSLLYNNCIHFALHLLGLAEFYMHLVKFPKERRSK